MLREESILCKQGSRPRKSCMSVGVRCVRSTHTHTQKRVYIHTTYYVYSTTTTQRQRYSWLAYYTPPFSLERYCAMPGWPGQCTQTRTQKIGHHDLGTQPCDCCESDDAVSASQPATPAEGQPGMEWSGGIHPPAYSTWTLRRNYFRGGNKTKTHLSRPKKQLH